MPAVRGPGRAEERRANSALVGAGPAPSEGLGGAWATAASRPAGSVGRQGGAGGQAAYEAALKANKKILEWARTHSVRLPFAVVQ